MLSEVLYADDLVLMSETIKGLRNKFVKLKKTFESKCMKVNLGKPSSWTVEALQRMAYLKVKLTYVGSAA